MNSFLQYLHLAALSDLQTYFENREAFRQPQKEKNKLCILITDLNKDLKLQISNFMWTLYSPQFPLQLLVHGIFGINPISILISLCCGSNLLKAILCPADHKMSFSKLPYMAIVPNRIILWYQSEEILILLKNFFNFFTQNLKQDYKSSS